MAKGFASSSLIFISHTLALLLAFIALNACSKTPSKASLALEKPSVESYPIANTQLRNCHFKDQAPVYGYNTPISPNPIQCDEGVAKKVELLSNTPLPNGILFSMNELSLVGTANQLVASAPYEFYIENEAGYQILKLQLTVR